jgi:hypothetical protein
LTFIIKKKTLHVVGYQDSIKLFGWYLLLIRRSQYTLAGTFHRRRSPLGENRFLQAGKGAENTKEKSRQCLLFGWRAPCKSAFYSSLIPSLIQC